MKNVENGHRICLRIEIQALSCAFMAGRRITIAHCNQCGHETDHTILKKHQTSGSDPADETWWETTFEMLECRGCHFVMLRRTFTFSEWDGSEVQCFPPRVSRRLPVWKTQLPSEVLEVMEEVYTALHANSRRLAMMGARTLIDMAILATVGDVGSFEAKLNAMKDDGYIAKRQLEVLEAALNAGHAAGHRGHLPSSDELNQVMDIVENLLQAIYVLGEVATKLKQSIPARQRKKLTN